jgi:WD40 repeat protein
MTDIFVSYAREDQAFVRQLSEALQAAGLEVWIDWKDIPPTAAWLQSVYTGIESAQTFAFVITKASISSEVCGWELAHAVKHNKRIAPLLRQDIDAKQVPEALSALNWIFFRPRDDFEAAVQTLLEAVRTDLEAVRTHTRILVRASEWEAAGRDSGYLLRGNDLKAALEWLSQASEASEPRPTSLQREYIQASQDWEAEQFERQETQRQKTLARRLATEAQRTLAARPGLLTVSLLLAIESIMREPSAAAEQVLRTGLGLLPSLISRMVHDHDVSVVSLSPDGTYLVSASGHLTEKEQYELEDSGKSSLEDFVDMEELEAWVERGKALIADMTGNTARLWEVASGRELAQVEHGGSVMAATFSPDGRYAATVSADGVAQVWEVPGGRRVTAIDLKARIWRGTVEFAAAGDYLVTVNGDHPARVWKISSGREVEKKTGQRVTGALKRSKKREQDQAFEQLAALLDQASEAELEETALALDLRLRSDWSKGDIIAALGRKLSQQAAFSPAAGLYVDKNEYTTDSDTVSLFAVPGGWEVARIGRDSFVSAVVFSPDGQYVITAAGGVVEVREVSPEPAVMVLMHEDMVQSLGFSRDGRYLAASNWLAFSDIAPKPSLWDSSAGQPVSLMAEGSEALEALQNASVKNSMSNLWSGLVFSPDRRFVATWDDDDQHLRVRERSGGADLTDLELAHYRRDMFFGAGSYGAGDQGEAKVWEVLSEEAVARDISRLEHETQLRYASFGPKGDYVATVTDDGSAYLWELRNGQRIGRLAPEGGSISRVAFSPEGGLLATVSEDGAIRLWEASTGKEIAAAPAEVQATGDVVWSSDGRYLASTSKADLAYVWEVPDFKEIARVAHAEREINGLAISPDGRYLATAGEDDTARVWELSTAREVAQLRHGDPVRAVAFSPVDGRLATGSLDRTVRLWTWQASELVASACNRLSRNLTREEWSRYMEDEPFRPTCPNLPISDA